MQLAELQALFWRAVRSDRPPPGLAQAFVGRDALSANRRMEIYRSAYWARHESCLRDSFPRLLAQLGPQAFRELVASYIAAHPSRVPCIERAGRDFAAHVRGQAEVVGRPAWLADLAELEWARLEVAMAEDADCELAVRELAAPEAHHRSLRMAPCLRIVRVHEQAWALWLADSAAPEHVQLEGRRWVALWRGRSGVNSLALPNEQGRALEAIARGATLAQASEHFEDPGAVERAAAALIEWMGRSWLIGWGGRDASV